MREIDISDIEKHVRQLCIDANTKLPSDLIQALKDARDREETPLPKSIFEIILENIEISKRSGIAACQDTGLAVIFIEIGQEVHFINGNLEDAINSGIRQGYEDGYLRKSSADPLNRKNVGDNTPGIIHYKIVPGDKVKITVAPKGFGSENTSALKMFNPTASKEEIKQFIINTVKVAGGKPCPPVLVGVGIGGTFEKAALISKEALIRKIGSSNENKEVRELESQLMDEINHLGIGPQGIGGKTTALGVHINTYPTHIAGLPIAVNICCHAVRHSSVEI